MAAPTISGGTTCNLHKNVLELHKRTPSVMHLGLYVVFFPVVPNSN